MMTASTGKSAQALLAGLLLLATSCVLAQDDTSSAADDAVEENPTINMDELPAIDEIIVYGGRSGDPVDHSALYDAELRQQVFDEVDRLRELEEEYAWRAGDLTEVESPSRIKWGYDPRDEYRVRQDRSLTELPIDRNKPATIFSVDF